MSLNDFQNGIILGAAAGSIKTNNVQSLNGLKNNVNIVSSDYIDIETDMENNTIKPKLTFDPSSFESLDNKVNSIDCCNLSEEKYPSEIALTNYVDERTNFLVDANITELGLNAGLSMDKSSTTLFLIAFFNMPVLNFTIGDNTEVSFFDITIDNSTISESDFIQSMSEQEGYVSTLGYRNKWEENLYVVRLGFTFSTEEYVNTLYNMFIEEFSQASVLKCKIKIKNNYILTAALKDVVQNRRK